MKRRRFPSKQDLYPWVSADEYRPDYAVNAPCPYPQRRDVLGIHWKCGKWYTQIQVDGVKKSLGYHSCLLDARAAYLRAKRSLFHV